MKSRRGVNYRHQVNGDIMKVEIRDFTFRILYKKRVNLRDINSIYQFLKVLEKFGDFSIAKIIKDRYKLDHWF